LIVNTFKGFLFDRYNKTDLRNIFNHAFCYYPRLKVYFMENPFEIILDRLNRIEQQLKDLKISTIQEVVPQPVKQWMNVPETAEYLSISSSKCNHP